MEYLNTLCCCQFHALDPRVAEDEKHENWTFLQKNNKDDVGYMYQSIEDEKIVASPIIIKTESSKLEANSFMYIIMYNCNLEDVLQNLSCLYRLEIKPETSSWVLLKYSVTVREKGGTTGTRARTLPNQEALGPEIEEGAVN